MPKQRTRPVLMMVAVISLIVAVSFTGGWYACHAIGAPTAGAKATPCSKLDTEVLENVVYEAYSNGEHLDPDDTDDRATRASLRTVVNNPDCFRASTVAEAEEMLSWEEQRLPDSECPDVFNPKCSPN